MDLVGEGMRHNDDRLQELLHLAKACVKVGRCPGDLRARDFFDRFDAEAREAAAREAAEDGELYGDEQARESRPARPLTPPPLAATPEEGLPPERQVSRWRREVRDLASAVSKKQQELELLNQEASREVLERCRASDELAAARVELKKQQRALNEVRDMYRLQERELEALQSAVASAKETSAALLAAKRLAVPPPMPLTSSATSAGAAGAGGGAERALPSLPLAPVVKSPPAAELSIDELKTSLLREVKDKKAPAAEARLWGRLRDENEKLASVIDAVGELGQQLRAPPKVENIGSGRGSKDGGASHPHGAGGSRSARAAVQYASLLGVPRPKPAYASVLSSRPANYKLYF
eukprot:TRINITY_DN15292_c0_g1_i1.p1 TRINITY_DN15292_c0_g1~~TRINITY_DN15292_c0_g1_i1.p1  ORF type:complete len:404 (+),score=106.66 TRINITY_DN15292_c0_g1_i1:162-1214(+)